MRALVNLCAVVVDAVADHRPPVVLALLDDVDLIAAARPVLVLPKPAGHGMERETLRIAMARAPDFWLGALPSDEGIVRRHRAIRPDPERFPEMVGKICA